MQGVQKICTKLPRAYCSSISFSYSFSTFPYYPCHKAPVFTNTNVVKAKSDVLDYHQVGCEFYSEKKHKLLYQILLFA